MKKLSTEEFITKAKNIHGDKYDYSKVEYVDNRTKVCIICPIHGEFWQSPDCHLQGNGCRECKKVTLSNLKTLTTQDFINKAKTIHGNKYDYSKVEYKDSHTKICIICPIHGEFWQSPNDHLQGTKCPKCSHRSYKYTKEEFIKKAQEIHENKYNYSEIKYVNIITKINVICPIHGNFLIKPHNHLQGQGCPLCKKLSILENDLEHFFIDNKLPYKKQYRDKFLGKQSLDFYIPSKKIAIECQGIQHFKSVDHFGGEEEFKKCIKRDKQKAALCEQKGIKLLYYSNLGIEYPYHVYEDKDELLKEILKE